MKYSVEVENRAARQIRALDPASRDRAMAVLVSLRDDPRHRGCVKLKGRTHPAWRVRAGNYRILYRIHDDRRLVRVYGVLRRDEAYRI